MRIGLDGIPLLTPKTGVGRYTFELASALTRLSRPPELVFFYGRHWGKRLKTSTGTNAGESYETSGNAVSRLIPAASKQWVRKKVFQVGLIGYRPDLFHATNYVVSSSGRPLVVTVHDLSFLRYPESHPPERIAWLSEGLPDTLRWAGRIIVDSRFIKDELISLLDVRKESITVVYLGVSQDYRPLDNKVLAPKLRELDLEPKGYILSVGTLEPRKNIISLLQAYELLPDSLKARWPLVVVGMRGWKDQAISKHLDSLVSSGRIRVLGYVSIDKLPFIYAGAALFVYPSLYEGFGLPPLEAMASGVPVIASNRASLPEILGNAGVLIDSEDIESLAGVIESLLDDRGKREQMGRMGLEQAEGFTWEACAENTFRVYEDVLRQEGI